MKKTILLLLCGSLLPIITWAQERSVIRKGQTGLRFALVIGNSDYQQTAKLRNPVNDARAIKSTLGELGFTVTTLENANQRQMENAIRKFGKTLRKDRAVGLFYYAGHGMQIDGENYLLPVEANPSNEDDVRYDGVPVGKLLGQMKSAGNSMNVVILDACRNNPFTRNFRSNRRGLAQVTAPTGTFISYATAPGSVAADGDGENGLYTEKLISHMRTPGLKLEEVFKKVRADVQCASNGKQVPWDASSVTGDFYFASLEKTGSPDYVPGETSVSVAVVAAPPQTSGLQLETLIKLAESQEQAKEKLKQVETQWAEWQSQMQSDFDAAETFERRKISPDLKIEPWRQFLEAYTSNNPFGKKDEALRREAQGRLKFWRSETKRVAEKTAALGSSSAGAGLAGSPEVSAPPANPDAEKIWNKYKLGLKRNLPKIAEKYKQKLLAEYPESNYAIQFNVAELQAALDKNGLSGALINKIEKIRAKHPRNPDLRKLIVQAIPSLLRGVDRFIEGGDLDFAEQVLSLAASWNVSSSELNRRRKQIQQIRISSLIKDADKFIKQGNAKNAEQKLNAALRLGADPAKIENIRRELPLTLAKVLIQSGKFEEAGEMLLEFELEGKYANELPKLYTALRNEQFQSKWNGILKLIKQKQFSKAEKEIEGWEIENAPSNLPKLKKYLQQEKTEFTQHINKRRERVRSLIDNNKFSDAKRELAQWEKTGEDQSELLKLTAYYKELLFPQGAVIDPSTGLNWHKKPNVTKRSWEDATRYCGVSDWRLPNVKELRYVFHNKHIFDPYKISSKWDSSYWSSDESSIYTRAYLVNFSTGNSKSREKSDKLYVRCVR